MHLRRLDVLLQLLTPPPICITMLLPLRHNKEESVLWFRISWSKLDMYSDVCRQEELSVSSWPSPTNSLNLPPTHRTIIIFSLTSPFLLFSLIRKHRPTHNSEGSMLVEGILSYTRNRRHHETKKPDVAFDDVLIQRELNMMGI